MSAIAGIYNRDQRSVDPGELQSMVASMAHRGPDGTGIWHKGPVGLGQCMLMTTPESMTESLPGEYTSDRRRICDLVITSDARIDNRQELFKSLSVPAESRSSTSDSQLILQAYCAWGEECLEQLDGDFAFAIWDATRNVLFCARDPIGTRSFYYYSTEHRFVFATEIKALLLLRDVPRNVNENRIADYLLGCFDDPQITFYQGIYRLPAASYLSITPDRFVQRTYWALDPTTELRLPTDRAYAEAFREVFTQSVHSRLRSNQSIASALSGGLDSTSIACIARDLLGSDRQNPLKTFSAVYSELPEPARRRVDEHNFIDVVLATGGFEPNYVQIGSVSPLVDLEKILWHLDEPPFAPNLSMHWAVLKAAQQAGIRVYLDGVDGDETVSHGFEYLAELARKLNWLRLTKEASAYSRNFPEAGNPRQVIWRHGLKPLIPDRLIKQVKKSRPASNSPRVDGLELLNSDFVKRIGYGERYERQIAKNSRKRRNAREMHWHNLSSADIPLALEWLDKIAAAFSLEIRFPFFDRRLMEFCLSLPANQKLSAGWTRAILRQGMAGVVPERVRWRTGKADFRAHFLLSLLENERERLENISLSRTNPVGAYLNPVTLKSAYLRYREDPGNHLNDAQYIYSGVILSTWLNREL